MSHSILVAGATGYLGGYLLRALLERGEDEVYALVRTAQQAQRLKALGARPLVARATAPEELRGLLEPIDTVVSSLGITRQRDGFSYREVDYGANLNLLREAERAGVERFGYVSVFRGPQLRHTALIGAKEDFVDALEASPIQSTVWRPTGFFSDMGDFLEMARSGRAWVFGDGQQRLNPIHGEDLAQACLEALDRGERESNLGGPEVLTMEEIARLAFAALGTAPRISRVPQWAVQAARWALPRLTPQSFYGPLEMFLEASDLDMVAPQHGHHRLADFFVQQAREPQAA